MKKVVLLVMGIMIFLVLTGETKQNGYLSADEKAQKQSRKIIEAVEKGDKKAIKKMCSEEFKSIENFDEQLDEFFEFIDGEIMSYDEPEGIYRGRKSSENGITEENLKGEIDNIKTDEGKTYRISFFSDSINKEYPECVGINGLGIYNEGTYVEGSGYPKYGMFVIMEEE